MIIIIIEEEIGLFVLGDYYCMSEKAMEQNIYKGATLCFLYLRSSSFFTPFPSLGV